MVGHVAGLDLAVRRLEEAVLVEPRVQRHRVDQADVRTLGRFDRADAAVVGRVHVAHLEAGALARQAARSQGGDATLVRDLRQRVGLVHELRQLARPEELADRRTDRLAVDQVVRHQVLGLGLAEALAHGALDTHQAGAELVLRQLADAAHAAVAEVVDVVDLAAAVAQLDQQLHRVDDVFVGQRHRPGDLAAAEAAVDLHATHLRQVVGLVVEEQAAEQRLDRVLGRRLARTHHAVDGDARAELVGGLVDAQRVADERTLVEVVGVDGADFLDVARTQLLHQVFGQLLVGVRDDLAGLAVDDVAGQHAAEEVVLRHLDALHARGFHVADVLGVDALVLLHEDLAGLVGDVEARDLAAQALGHEFHVAAGVAGDLEAVEGEEVREDLLARQADGLEQDRRRHLAAAVDAEVQDVLRVELEVEPRTAVGNHARREQQLAARVRLAAVMLEEHARRAMQLRHDHALGAVDDERAGGRHERDLAHVDLLLLHFLDRRLGGLAIHDHQAHLGAQRRRVGQAALLAFLDVERRVAEVEATELEPRHLVVAADREDRVEGGLQAFGLALGHRRVRLQELGVGLELGRQQERHGLHGRTLGKALADTLLFGERVRHGRSVRLELSGRAGCGARNTARTTDASKRAGMAARAAQCVACCRFIREVFGLRRARHSPKPSGLRRR